MTGRKAKVEAPRVGSHGQRDAAPAQPRRFNPLGAVSPPPERGVFFGGGGRVSCAAFRKITAGGGGRRGMRAPAQRGPRTRASPARVADRAGPGRAVRPFCQRRRDDIMRKCRPGAAIPGSGRRGEGRGKAGKRRGGRAGRKRRRKPPGAIERRRRPSPPLRLILLLFPGSVRRGLGALGSGAGGGTPVKHAPREGTGGEPRRQPRGCGRCRCCGGWEPVKGPVGRPVRRGRAGSGTCPPRVRAGAVSRGGARSRHRDERGGGGERDKYRPRRRGLWYSRPSSPPSLLSRRWTGRAPSRRDLP